MTMILDRIHPASSRRERRVSLGSLLSATVAAMDHGALELLRWFERAQQRRQLLGLSDHALRDFGATRCDADREGSKPFWQS